MSKERRYQEHEVQQILDLAIGPEGAPAQSFPASEGLTLVQLQEVGREVGLPPTRITEAVAAFEGRGESIPRGKALGLPMSVGSILALPRNPSDREWELLVAELRTTFGGKGEMTSQGGLREWSNGFFHAFIEPTETGYRLRMTDSRVNAIAGIAFGGFFVAFALMIFLALLGKDDAGFRFAIPAFFSLIGGGLVAGSAMSLPGWAREQEKRMEHINRRAVSILLQPPL